ncbi:hypothetical protein D3C71_1210600 [compost metagenome]
MRGIGRAQPAHNANTGILVLLRIINLRLSRIMGSQIDVLKLKQTVIVEESGMLHEHIRIPDMSSHDPVKNGGSRFLRPVMPIIRMRIRGAELGHQHFLGQSVFSSVESLQILGEASSVFGGE